MNINNVKVKFNLKENIQAFDEGEENESPRIYNRVEVENAMRNKLFSNKKRNKSLFLFISIIIFNNII